MATNQQLNLNLKINEEFLIKVKQIQILEILFEIFKSIDLMKFKMQLKIRNLWMNLRQKLFHFTFELGVSQIFYCQLYF
ncbi:unnamed protein product [Paramecium pentaurelia]|uniref:Uncharacterized protein n=1 Tax=Paramecium pentaurelia TaxID=43138 RepID=A0A8S1Y4R0_9CILI|nr:unnamed protein product [Paramecium pentaurelia]